MISLSFFILSLFMSLLTSFVTLSVAGFSRKLLRKDPYKRSFLSYLMSVWLAVTIFIWSDHSIILILAYGSINICILLLIRGKSSWHLSSLVLTPLIRTLIGSFLALLVAFLFLTLSSDLSSLKDLIQKKSLSLSFKIGLFFLLVSTVVQSAIWPFDRWLVSSLFAPSPVSAILHAGVINSSLFLLIRFGPLYQQCPFLLTLMVIIGSISAFIGTTKKLIQNDVKKMLVYSTVGQMGFTLLQCGLGLFPCAMSHLLGHSLFKAYSFLSCSGVVEEKKVFLFPHPSLFSLLEALAWGIWASLLFSWLTGFSWLAKNTSLLFLVLIAIAGTHTSLVLPRSKKGIVSTILGLSYGITMITAEVFLGPVSPLPLNVWAWLALFSLVIPWLIPFLWPLVRGVWANRLYVIALNASQPASSYKPSKESHDVP